MRILIVHPEINIKYGTYGYQSGLAALSAALKNNGFNDLSLVHLSPTFQPENFRSFVETIKPDLIGFYTTYNQYRYIEKLAALIPQNTFSVLGGPHPTIYPACLEQLPNINAICIGEGDQTIVELAQAIKDKKSIKDIPGLVYRDQGQIVHNDPRPFIVDLSTLPYEDRTLFEKTRANKSGLLEISFTNSLRLGRGCPFNCSFCSNFAQSKAQSGKYVRFRGLDHIFGEIRELIDRYDPKVFYFQDDTFMSSKEIVEQFCDRYQREIGLPFEFFGRIDLVAEDLLEKIRDAGGRRVSYGVESGDQHIRLEVLHKRFSNQDVVDAFAITKKLGITAEAFVMIGFPEETPESFEETANLLREVQPDLYTLSTYFPNPGTELHQKAKREGLLAYESVPMGLVNQRDVMLNMPQFTPKQIRSARRWFAFRVYGGISLRRALLFFTYESWLGDVLLRLIAPVRKQLRRFALS